MWKIYLPAIGVIALLQVASVDAWAGRGPGTPVKKTARKQTRPKNTSLRRPRPDRRERGSKPRRLQRQWSAEHRVQAPKEYGGRVVEISSRFQAGKGQGGSVWSMYLKGPKTWVIEAAYAGTLPALTDKGTASWKMITEQMRHLDVKPGDLRSIRLADINNVPTVLHIYEHGESVDPKTLPVARGLIRALERSGVRVSKLSLSRSHEHHPHEIGKLMSAVEATAEARGGKEARQRLEAHHDRTLERLGLDRASKVPVRWDVDISLSEP